MPALLRRPLAPVDPALEDEAARVLELARGKAVRRTAPPQAGAIAAKILRPILPAKTSLTLNDLKLRWAEIVGEKLAAMTQPEKLGGGAQGRVLTICAAGPAAPFVQHQAPLLKERCNLAGADLAAIQIRQGQIKTPSRANVRPLAAPLAADEERALADSVSDIECPNLRAALMRLGRAVKR